MKPNPASVLVKNLIAVLLFFALGTELRTVFAQGTAFTYQGRLTEGAAPASGAYDFRFALYDNLTAGTVIAGPITNSPATVSNGVFVVTIDFGPGAFSGLDQWLEIA